MTRLAAASFSSCNATKKAQYVAKMLQTAVDLIAPSCPARKSIDLERTLQDCRNPARWGFF